MRCPHCFEATSQFGALRPRVRQLPIAACRGPRQAVEPASRARGRSPQAAVPPSDVQAPCGFDDWLILAEPARCREDEIGSTPEVEQWERDVASRFAEVLCLLPAKGQGSPAPVVQRAELSSRYTARGAELRATPSLTTETVTPSRAVDIITVTLNAVKGTMPNMVPFAPLRMTNNVVVFPCSFYRPPARLPARLLLPHHGRRHAPVVVRPIAQGAVGIVPPAVGDAFGDPAGVVFAQVHRGPIVIAIGLDRHRDRLLLSPRRCRSAAPRRSGPQQRRSPPVNSAQADIPPASTATAPKTEG